MSRVVLGVALTVVMTASAAVAQTPAAPAPAAAAQTPPAPFPEGAKVAYVVLQRVANDSAEGRAATERIKALQQKRATELAEKQKQIQGIQAKLEKEVSVLSTTAQADLTKQAERINTEIQRFTQDAQAEIGELQQQLMQQFEARVQPVLDAVAKEKGLHFIFNAPEAGLIWADPGLDVSADVIKRLDATAKPQGQN